jgi:general secretion pathway protein I
MGITIVAGMTATIMNRAGATTTATAADAVLTPGLAAEAGKRHQRLPVAARAQHGFALFETLVAFVIAALALAVLYQAGLSGLHSTEAATHYEQAVARARSRLTLAEHASPLIAGDWRGDDGGGFFWRVRIAPLASTTVQPPTALTLAGSASFPLTLYAVTVWVNWHDADATREVRLDSEQIGQGVR